jgi:cobalt-zinc-cadmium resistance protein CzcA
MVEHLIRFSLHNRLLMVVILLLVMVAGYWTYHQLPIDAFPDVSPNLVQVFTVTEGLAPEEVEKYITYPVEAAMTGLPGIKEIRSISNFGLSVVSIYFEDHMDIYFCRQIVSERLGEARAQIPEGFGEPEMGPIATGMGLVLYYYLEDIQERYSLEALRSMQDWIVKLQLQSVPGVTEVLGIGGFVKQYHVNIDPDALLRYGITLHEVIERIQANNLTVGAQFIEQASEQFTVRSAGLATGIDDLDSIIMKTQEGRPIFLRDIATIRIGGAIRRGLQTRNGQQEIVGGLVVQLYGSNASTVIKRVEAKLAEVEKALPQGVRIVPYYQQKTLVQQSITTVTEALVQGIVFVALVLLVFMGSVRPSLVVAIAIPFSVLFACLAMGYFGISANLMSLGGLAIAIGLMVDGTIVMVENVDRHLWEAAPDASRIRVVSRACREVARPIAFAILIIIVVFLPLFTLQGVEGKTFRPLAYTVALAMLGSLIFALLAAPTLSDLLLRQTRPSHDKPAGGLRRIWVRILKRGKWASAPSTHASPHPTRAAHRPHEPRIVEGLLKAYRPVVVFFVHRRGLAVALAMVLIAIGIVIFPRLGSEFTPRLNEGDIIANITMAPSISLTETARLTRIVERRILGIPEVQEVVSRIGRGEVGAHADPINTVHALVVLRDKSLWRHAKTQEAIEIAIRNQVADLPGVLINLTQPIQLTVDELVGGVKAELAVKLFGDDLATLKQHADQLAALLRPIRGAADVQADQVVGAPQLVIRPDRQAIARYGINLERVQETIRTAIGGTTAGQVFEGVRRFDIYVRYQQQARQTPEDISQVLIEAPNGLKAPLSQLASIETVIGPRQITRENAQRFVTVQCNVVDRDMGSFVKEARALIDEQLALPPGYFITWGGQFELQQAANRRLGIVIPATLVLLSLLLFASFGSLANALLILLNIPLALVGGIVGLWLAGAHLSVPASVGFIALFGIALENGMVLVTYLNQLVRQGMPINEASILGACLRLRPVLMTAATTSLGLLPLLLVTGTGSEVQRPLATVVIGGLASSTVLTLLVLPALYKWFAVRAAQDSASPILGDKV